MRKYSERIVYIINIALSVLMLNISWRGNDLFILEVTAISVYCASISLVHFNSFKSERLRAVFVLLTWIPIFLLSPYLFFIFHAFIKVGSLRDFLIISIFLIWLLATIWNTINLFLNRSNW